MQRNEETKNCRKSTIRVPWGDYEEKRKGVDMQKHYSYNYINISQ